MAATESWVLNGLDISSGNYQILELDVTPPKERPEWITAADSEWGALSRQPLHENRVITMKLRVTPQASMDTAMSTRVGAVVDQLRNASEIPDGIPLVWTPANSTKTVTFDVLDGEITELPISVGDQGRSWFAQRPIVTVVLTCKPYWRGSETTTSSASSGATPFASLEITGVPGDIPALGRLIVTDAATQSRRFVEWGLESQNYSGTGNALILDSDSLVTSGFGGAQATVSGAYDPNATGNNAVQISPPAVITAMAGTGVQGHVGTFRVWARVMANSDTQQVRLAWHVGDGPYASNAWVQSAAPTGGWSEVDLGLVTIPPAVSGTQRWDGRVEVLDNPDTGAAPSAFNLDYLLLVPAAEGYGHARAVYRYIPGVLVARDEFTGTTAGGALNGRVAPQGGTWATSGAITGDFLFADASGSTQERIQRATTIDGGFRFGILGSTNYTDVEVGARMWRSTATLSPGLLVMSVIARWTNSTTYFAFDLLPPSQIRLRVAGGVPVAVKNVPLFWANLWYRARLQVFASGRAIGSILDDNGHIIDTVEMTSTALATGGSLATGLVGVADSMTTAISATRLYDDFYAATPPAEPISLYSGRQIEFRHDTVVRQDSGGTYYGRPPAYRGSRFTLSPGTSRVMVKARRNDPVTSDAASVTDNTSFQVAYTPRGLVVPR